MKRREIASLPFEVPDEILTCVSGAKLFDSSCSPEASVVYIEKDEGFFLKRSAKGTLQTEAELDAFFHKKGLSAEVLCYLTSDFDYLLTKRINGEDLTHCTYKSDPTRLCDTLAFILRELHECQPEGCPVQNRTATYLETVEKNHALGMFDPTYLTKELKGMNAEDAHNYVKSGSSALKSDTLLHGDYCLPNVILDGWRFSGFIDLGNGGIGDRHIDLYWGAWTLNFNLHTDKYRDRFFDAYGRDKVDTEFISLIGAAETFG